MLKRTLAARPHLMNKPLCLAQARMLHLALANTNNETKPQVPAEHMVLIVNNLGEVVTIIGAHSSLRHTGMNQVTIGVLTKNAPLLGQRALSKFT